MKDFLYGSRGKRLVKLGSKQFSLAKRAPSGLPKWLLALICLAACAPAPTLANIVSLETVPTTWRLENYSGDSVVIHYTGVACGTMYFGPGWSVDDRNRLWSLITAAKVAGRVVGIRYEDSNCQISSFFFKEG